MARPNVVRSQPFSASIGSWKKPMAERGPKVSAAIRQPQMMISHGTDLAGGRSVACSGHVMGRSPVRRQHFLSRRPAPSQNELVAWIASISLMRAGINGRCERLHTEGRSLRSACADGRTGVQSRRCGAETSRHGRQKGGDPCGDTAAQALCARAVARPGRGRRPRAGLSRARACPPRQLAHRREPAALAVHHHASSLRRPDRARRSAAPRSSC